MAQQYSLKALANEMSESAHKRARIEPTFKSFRDEIFCALMRIHDFVTANSYNPALLEVEVSLLTLYYYFCINSNIGFLLIITLHYRFELE